MPHSPPIPPPRTRRGPGGEPRAPIKSAGRLDGTHHGTTPALPFGARLSDPQTSQIAAASMRGQVLAREHGRVLEALRHLQDDLGQAGGTAHEVTRTPAYADRYTSAGIVAKRLGELERLGLVRRPGATRPGPSGRPQLVAILAAEGRAALGSWEVTA